MIAIKSYGILHIVFVTSVILFTFDLIAAFLVAQCKVQEENVGWLVVFFFFFDVDNSKNVRRHFLLKGWIK